MYIKISTKPIVIELKSFYMGKACFSGSIRYGFLHVWNDKKYLKKKTERT